jgi:hypothetical protein
MTGPKQIAVAVQPDAAAATATMRSQPLMPETLFNFWLRRLPSSRWNNRRKQVSWMGQDASYAARGLCACLRPSATATAAVQLQSCRMATPDEAYQGVPYCHDRFLHSGRMVILFGVHKNRTRPKQKLLKASSPVPTVPTGRFYFIPEFRQSQDEIIFVGTFRGSTVMVP